MPSAEALEIFGFQPGKPFKSIGATGLERHLAVQFPDSPKPIPIEIDALLNQSALPPEDERYARTILQIDPANTDLAQSVGFLLKEANTTLSRRKLLERGSQLTVSLDDVLAPFSEDERVILTQNLGSVQLTDGCTVGCAWCGLNALRQTTRAFSLESVNNLANKSGRGNPFGSLYWESDPFDWVEGGYSYLDLHSTWSLQTGAPPFVSTAVPPGSEFSILRFIEATDEAIKLLDTPDIISHAQRFRFSRTDKNTDRLEHMLRILRHRRVSEEFMKNMLISELDSDHIQNIGYFIKHPDRDEIRDNPGITCQDAVVISPNKGVTGITMEAYTQNTPKGMSEWVISPGKMTVPLILSRTQYDTSDLPTTVNPNFVAFSFVPPVTLLHVEDGKVKKRERVHSVGREAYTFVLAAYNLRRLNISLESEGRDTLLANFPAQIDGFKRCVRGYKGKFNTRKYNATDLLEDPNEEAVRILRAFVRYGELELAHLEATLKEIDPPKRKLFKLF